MRRFQIDQLIINSPYEEPTTYWSYDREVRMFERKDGRRPAGYVVATPGSKAFDDPGVFVELPLVNQIRPRVQAWREAGYMGVTGITKRLLEHWRDPEERKDRRFFFCQLESIETLIWLTEASPAERQGFAILSSFDPFYRRGLETEAGCRSRCRRLGRGWSGWPKSAIMAKNQGLPP
ncbi:MAG: hypothetical protein WBE26_16395 [Phycisphaerae bacterium]